MLPPGLANQVGALLADQDRHAALFAGERRMLEVALAGHRATRGQLAATRAELAEVTTDRDQYREWNQQARVTLAGLQPELIGAQAEVARLEEEVGDADRIRRDAAADALEWAADQSVCAAIDTDAHGTAEERSSLRTWAAEVRDGTRSVKPEHANGEEPVSPGQPEQEAAPVPDLMAALRASFERPASGEEPS
jgi:hypothetical protein